MAANRDDPTFTDRVADAAIRFFVGRALRMPWDQRVAYMGRIMSRYLSPVLRYPRRIARNLAFVYPGMDAARRAEIARAVADNMGRTFAEIYSGEEFIERFEGIEIEGPGLAALEAARAEGRGAMLITGHFGNYEVPRVALIGRGFDIAGLYRPMNNPLFNIHYEAAMKRIGPAYTKDRSGLTQLVRHLRGGGITEMLIDQHYGGQPVLDFLGKPAHTSIVAAELALRNEVPLICMYGVRQPDGVSFRVMLEAPIPPTTALEMTQAVNDSLGAVITDHPGQWLWMHRRWRVEGNRP